MAKKRKAKNKKEKKQDNPLKVVEDVFKKVDKKISKVLKDI